MASKLPKNGQMRKHERPRMNDFLPLLNFIKDLVETNLLLSCFFYKFAFRNAEEVEHYESEFFFC